MRNLAGQLEALQIGPVPAPWNTFTFLVTEDGVERTETVRLDFSDIPPEVMARIIFESNTSKVDDVAAGILAYRLTVPKDAALALLKQMRRGRGVTSGN